MPNTEALRVSDFDFDLPEHLIALRPSAQRDEARMLVVAGADRRDLIVRDLPSLLRAGDVLVLNDTRVLPARLAAVRRRAWSGTGPQPGDVAIEILLDRRLSPARWSALARPAKRLKVGDMLDVETLLSGVVAAVGEDGFVEIEFMRSGAALDEALEAAGEVPLPPYVAARRATDEQDRSDYQTTYAREPGAVAAPTAGLHLTDAMFDAIRERGIAIERLTLHVGAGTFLPVRTDRVADHRMHPEWGRLDAGVADRINAARAAGGRIVAVGTTSLRLLETACDGRGRFEPFEGETRIFITPGCPVRGADLLMTNFHTPRSTLFMLVCAFAGTDAMRAAYAHAIERGYRFYSYGDASLLTRAASA